MSVENIKNAILGDAQKEAERVREAGRKKADEKYRRAERRLRRNFQQRVAEAEQHHQNIKKRSTIALRGSLNMELLAAKNAVIDKVFAEAVERTVALPRDGYKNLLLKWLSDAAPPEPAQLILNARDREAFGKDLIDSVNKDRTDADVTLADETGEIGGGFVLRTGKYEIDQSLDSIIAKLKEEMAPEIAAELFGGGVERL